MALDNFIPTIWSNQLLVSLKKAHVYGQPNVANRDYEGEIRTAGDTVKINAIGAVTIGDYTKDTDITAPQTLDGAQSVLTITEQKFFNFQVDDIDKVQGRPAVMAQAMTEAAYGLRNTADLFLAAQLVAGVASGNTVGTTGAPETIVTATDAYDLLVELRVRLNMANVPDAGRWVIVPPFYEGQLLKDERFTHATDMGDRNLLNGQIGRAAGFEILMSNSVPHEGTGAVGEYYRVFGGTNLALSFAEQIVSVEGYRMEKRFADAVKGLHVYGGKVIRPEALVQLIVDRPTV